MTDTSKWIGFHTDAILIELSKVEIARRGYRAIWHGEFTQDLVCYSQICGTFVVPKGFVTDGASVPKPLWWALSDNDPDILYGSFAHDFIYSVHGCLSDRVVTRDQADNMLREQMLIVDAPRWKADIVYRAVHMFGPKNWDKITPAYKLAQTEYAPRPEVRTP